MYTLDKQKVSWKEKDGVESIFQIRKAFLSLKISIRKSLFYLVEIDTDFRVYTFINNP